MRSTANRKTLDGTALELQGWTGGMNSALYPAFLSPSQYRRAINVSNRDGLISPRPGFVQVDALPDGLLQGAFLFNEALPAGGVNSQWVVAISGMIYLRPATDTPGTPWTRVSGVSLASTATTVRFARMERFADSSGASIVLLLNPESVLVAVDGVSLPVAIRNGAAVTLPGVVKGASHVATAGNRVWFAVANRVLASDFGDPVSFTEHLEEGPASGAFYFDSEVTALYPAPSQNQQNSPLLVFTSSDSEALRADVVDREQWTAQGFRQSFASGVGCLDSDSIVKHEGTLWWVSASGLVSADRAVTSYVSSRLARRDVELRAWDPLLSTSPLAKSASHDGRLLVSRSLTSGDVATAVLDGAVIGDVSGETPPVWASFWTGPRIRSWHPKGSSLYCFGSDLSPAYGTRNRLWKMVPGSNDSALKPNQSGGFQAYVSPIKWSFDTGYFGGPDSGVRILKTVDFDFVNTEAGFSASASVKGPFSASASLGSGSCALASGAWRFQSNEPEAAEGDSRGLAAGRDKHFGLTLSCRGVGSLVLVSPHLQLLSETGATHPVDSEGSPVETPFTLPSHNPVTASL